MGYSSLGSCSFCGSDIDMDTEEFAEYQSYYGTIALMCEECWIVATEAVYNELEIPFELREV